MSNALNVLKALNPFRLLQLLLVVGAVGGGYYAYIEVTPYTQIAFDLDELKMTQSLAELLIKEKADFEVLAVNESQKELLIPKTTIELFIEGTRLGEGVIEAQTLSRGENTLVLKGFESDRETLALVTAKIALKEKMLVKSNVTIHLTLLGFSFDLGPTPVEVLADTPKSVLGQALEKYLDQTLDEVLDDPDVLNDTLNQDPQKEKSITDNVNDTLRNL